MPFTTYENRHNPHITIHNDGCSQIKKRGGEHSNNQGKYHHHLTFIEAQTYSETTKLPVITCSFCKPK